MFASKRILLGVSVLVLIVIFTSFGVATNSEQSGGDALPCGQNVGCPTGLASYGYDASNGQYFFVESNLSVGEISSYALQANNSLARGPWASNDPALANGSSLQLNNMLLVKNKDGSQDVYWAQNVLSFGNDSSNNRIVIFEDNVFNETSQAAEDTIPNITSPNGTIGGSNTTYYYYGNYIYAPYFYLNIPFTLEPFMQVSTGTGDVIIDMGVYIWNGTAFNIYHFDTVTISAPEVSSAYFNVDYALNPTGHHYDSEFVFGGPSNGASTTFSAMNSTIGLFYVNSSDYTVPFQSYYSYGSDTAESASNLLVTYLGNGDADVTLGSPYYGPLTSTSSTSSHTSTYTNSTVTSSTSTSSSNASSSTSSISSTSSNSSSVSSITSSSSSSSTVTSISSSSTTTSASLNSITSSSLSSTTFSLSSSSSTFSTTTMSTSSRTSSAAISTQSSTSTALPPSSIISSSTSTKKSGAIPAITFDLAVAGIFAVIMASSYLVLRRRYTTR